MTTEILMTDPCMMRFVLSAKRRAKCPLSPQKADLYIAETATQREEETDSSFRITVNSKKLETGIACFYPLFL